MAAVVDISDTKHLSYSPLNKKHNILYRNARQSFSHRYKQKPWFRLNSFTDKSVGKGENIECYDPNLDAGLSLLQSLVIVEDYFNDAPQFQKEFKIREFWDFLFSDSWSHGYAVRVFEGELTEQIVTCLMSLISSGKVVKNVTKAFARNTRRRYSVVKTSKKSKTELVPFTETLFLQFIYYGHTLKPACFDSDSSVGYPDVTTTTTTNSSCVRASTDSYSSEQYTSSQMEVSRKPPSPLPAIHACQNHRVTRVRASQNAQRRIEKERELITSYLSRNESTIPNALSIPRGKKYRYTCSNFSNASDDYKTLPPKDNLNNFICTENVSYLGEFSLPDDISSTSSEDEEEEEKEDDYKKDDADFGQQFYLGETEDSVRKAVFETTEMKLKKRKDVLKQMREKRKQEISELKPTKNNIMPEFSELDVKKYVEPHEMKNVVDIKENDRIPTLVEYADMLEAIQKEKAKLKLKAKYNAMIKKVTKQAANEILRGKSKEPGNAFWKSGNSAQKKLLLQNMERAKKKRKIKTNKTVPLVYVSTAAEKTLLHPVSKELSQRKKIEEQKNDHIDYKRDVLRTRRTSFLPTAPNTLVHELQKVRKSSKESLNPEFPKLKLIPSNIESPDYSDDSDKSEDDLDQSLFDTKKLNIRYSIDRIKKIKALNKEEEKEVVPHFAKILKKYFRVKSILTAFCKPVKKQLRAGAKSSKRKKMKKPPEKALDICKESDTVESSPLVKVGKLKWFSFLEAKEKKKGHLAESMNALFESYPIELFCENLERALKEFVVRREIVMSDYNGKSLASVTFTKKSVFTSSKFAYKSMKQ